MDKKLLYYGLLLAFILVFGFFIKNTIIGKSQINPEEELKNIDTKSLKSQVVNVYSSRKEELIKDLFTEFTLKSNIKVNYIIDDPSKLIARMKSEGKNTQADVFLTADVINLLLAQENDLLSPIQSQILKESVPSNLRDEYWIAITKRARMIAYAKDRVKPEELSTYEDLASAKWNKKLLMRSSNSSYNQSLLASIVAADGQREARSWVNGIVDNFVRKPSGGDTDQIRAVAAGEGDLTVVNSYYVARMMASSDLDDKKIIDKIGIFFPNQQGRGTMMNISGAGISKYSKNYKNAVTLLEFMLSPQAQQIYAEKNQEYPVLKSVKCSDVLSSWGEYKADKMPLKDLAKYMQLAVEISDQEGWK